MSIYYFTMGAALQVVHFCVHYPIIKIFEKLNLYSKCCWLSRELSKVWIMAKLRKKESVSVGSLANPNISSVLRMHQTNVKGSIDGLFLCKFRPHRVGMQLFNSATQGAAAGGMLDGVTQEVFQSVNDFCTVGETFLLYIAWQPVKKKSRVVHIISLTTGTQRGGDGVQKGNVETKEPLLDKGQQASLAAAY